MGRKVRILFFSIFATIFFAVGISIVFYFSGHTYDFKNNTVVDTGSIVLETAPKEVMISIDGSERMIKTPTVVNNLLPGNYKITIKKEDYAPWEKTLNVTAQEATVMRDILLFSEKIVPEKFSENEYPVMKYLVPEKNIVIAAVKKNNETYLEKFTLKKDEDTEHIQTIPGDVSDITVLSKNDFIVKQKTADTTNHMLYVDEKEKKDIETLTGNPVKNIQRTFPHPDDANRWLILIDEKLWDIKEITQDEITATEIDDNVDDFILKGRIFYTIQHVNEKTKLFEKSTLDTKKIPKLIKELTGDTHWKIINADEEKIYMISNKNELVNIIYDAEKPEEKLVTANVMDAVWNEGHSRLLWWNNFELWVFDPIEEKSTLITRQSTPLHDVRWYTPESHIIFSDEKGIHIIETDTRDAALSTTVFTGEGVKNFFVTEKEKELWVYQDSQLFLERVR